jgi:hypothetical protein
MPDMKRRSFITLLGGMAAAWPLAMPVRSSRRSLARPAAGLWGCRASVCVRRGGECNLVPGSA